MRACISNTFKLQWLVFAIQLNITGLCGGYCLCVLLDCVVQLYLRTCFGMINFAIEPEIGNYVNF